MRKIFSLATRCIVSAMLVSVSFATTYVVDSQGGGNFTTITAAIAAAAPGDVLLVMPGAYGGFDLPIQLTILGQAAGVAVTGPVTIHDVVAGQATVIAKLSFYKGAALTNCADTVVLESMICSDTVQVTSCADVRFSRCAFSTPDQVSYPNPGHDTLLAVDSRVEVAESTLRPGYGGDQSGGIGGADGGEGIQAYGLHTQVDVHVYRTSIVGGEGGYPDCSAVAKPAGHGGLAINLGLNTAAPASNLLIAGQPQHAITGGKGDWQCPNFSYTLADGVLISPISAARCSGAMISSIDNLGYLESPTPADPTLDTLAPIQAGQTTKFEVRAAPGASADLILGRTSIVVPVSGLVEDQLVVQQRVFHLGTIGATGVATFAFPVSASYPKGFTFFAQARVAFAPNDVRYTNSVPLVVR